MRTFWAENPAHKKVEALRRACDKHSSKTKACAQAQGQDRHLYALLSVWQRSVDWEGKRSAEASTNGSTDGVRSVGNSPVAHSVASDQASDSVSRPRTDSHSHAMPAIFADAGYDKINNTILSTSNCGNPSLRHFGFGPTSAEGFGIGYIIKDGSIFICASSKHRQKRRYVDAMESYFLEIRKLLRQTHRGSSQDKTASRAREVEEEQPKSGRTKNRGKAIFDNSSSKATTASTATLEEEEEDEEGLGGCKCRVSHAGCESRRTADHCSQMDSSMQECCCRHSRHRRKTNNRRNEWRRGIMWAGS